MEKSFIVNTFVRTLAYISIKVPLIEKMLRLCCLKNIPGSLRIAYTYPSVLKKTEIRRLRSCTKG